MSEKEWWAEKETKERKRRNGLFIYPGESYVWRRIRRTEEGGRSSATSEVIIEEFEQCENLILQLRLDLAAQLSGRGHV